MQKHFIIFFLLIAGLHVKGQIVKDIHTNPEIEPFQKEIIARVNFLGAIDAFDHNISLGAEYQFNAKWSAGIDAGYIFESEYITNNKQVKGIILRPFLRYYLKEKRKGFIEANLHYKNVVYKVEDWIGRDITNGVPSYEEFSIYNFKKRVLGINLVIGNKWNLNKKTNNINLEPYVGFGVRVREQNSDDVSFSFNRNIFLSDFNSNSTFPAILLGMRLTFKL